MIIAINIFHDAIYGPQAVYFSELFGTKVRLSGANIGYAIGSVLSGGFAPMIATALLAANDGKTWGISTYIVRGTLREVTFHHLVKNYSRRNAQASHNPSCPVAV